MQQEANGWSWEATYEIWLGALNDTYREMVEAAAALVPGVVGAVLLLFGGWLVAVVLRALIARFGTGIDRVFHAVRDRVGQPHFDLRWPISRIVACTVYWLVILFFLAAVSRSLGLPGVARIFAEVLAYLPLLLVWAAVALALYMASGPVAAVVTASARSAGLENAGLLGRMARVVALTFAGIIVVSQLGIDLTLLVNVVTIATAALLGGAAVAFGIGAGGTTGNLIAAHYVRRNYRVGQRVAVASFEGEILEITRSAVILDTEQGRTMVPARLFNEQASVLKEREG
ncbi:MAG: mechanosensitive ion channel [Deltaproteobacteria bacterium]|nr:mechanosensitive ion channel [Deltaproteobacteria bacterium]MDE0343301.1 mechanosensitive ion channel [Deltaproteobacteria bacterium]